MSIRDRRQAIIGTLILVVIAVPAFVLSGPNVSSNPNAPSASTTDGEMQDGAPILRGRADRTVDANDRHSEAVSGKSQSGNAGTVSGLVTHVDVKGQVVVPGGRRVSDVHVRIIQLKRGSLGFERWEDSDQQISLDEEGHFAARMPLFPISRIVVSVSGRDVVVRSIWGSSNDGAAHDLGAIEIPRVRQLKVRVHGLGTSAVAPVLQDDEDYHERISLKGRVVFGRRGDTWTVVETLGTQEREHDDGAKDYVFHVTTDGPYDFRLRREFGHALATTFRIAAYESPDFIHEWHVNAVRLRIDRAALGESVETMDASVQIETEGERRRSAHFPGSSISELLLPPRRDVMLTWQCKFGTYRTTLRTPEAGQLVTWRLKTGEPTGSLRTFIRRSSDATLRWFEVYLEMVDAEPLRSWRYTFNRGEHVVTINDLPVGKYVGVFTAYYEEIAGASIASDVSVEIRQGEHATITPQLVAEATVTGEVKISLNKNDRGARSPVRVTLWSVKAPDAILDDSMCSSAVYEKSLRPGRYVIRLEAKAYESTERRFEVRPGETSRVRFQLKSID